MLLGVIGTAEWSDDSARGSFTGEGISMSTIWHDVMLLASSLPRRSRRQADSVEARRSILLVVENLPVPYDRRVWQEALALKAANFQVSVISPATKLHPKLSESLEGIHIYRYPMM